MTEQEKSSENKGTTGPAKKPKDPKTNAGDPSLADMRDAVVAQHKSLLEALFAAQRDMKPVEHDGKNEDQKYDYTSAEAIMIEARRVLHANELFYEVRSATMRHDNVQASGQSRSGSWQATMPSVLVTKFRLWHVPTRDCDEWVDEWPIVPGPGRPYDKAVASARTASIAYRLRDLLLIPRVAEGDDLNDPRAQDKEREKADKGRQRTGAQSEALKAAFRALGVDSDDREAYAKRLVGDDADLMQFTVADTLLKKLQEEIRAKGKPAPKDPEAPPQDEEPKEKPAKSNGKKSSTAVLLEFKAAVDAAKNTADLDAADITHSGAVAKLPDAPRAMADGYMAGRRAALAGEEMTEAQAKATADLNELAKM